MASYDVFISHSGKDSKRNFASMLRMYLENKGVRCFFDVKDLHPGDIAPEAMLEAMETAHFGVVILSSTYFEREWCIKELQTFVERKNLLPIFLGIEPDHLKHFSESAAWKTFSKFGITEEEYRRVVQAAGSFTGLRLSALDGFWAQCIEQVALELIHRLGRLQGGVRLLSPNTLLVGVDKHLAELKRLMGLILSETEAMLAPGPELVLQSAAKSAGVIGIVGMGGLGKTTLAKRLYDDPGVREAFEGRICWVEVNQSPKLCRIQEQLLRTLCNQEDPNVPNPSVGLSKLEERLSSLKVLVVFDNAWDQAWCRQVLNPDLVGAGSCIVVTTRSSDAIRQDAHTSYMLDRLDPEAAWQLFCVNAFKGSREAPLARLETLAFRAAEMCGGLPLVLEVVGALAAQKTSGLEEESKIGWWKDTLLPGLENHKLDALAADVIKVLRLSYAGLQEDVKEAFVLLAGCWKEHLENFDTDTVVLKLAAVIYEDESNPLWSARCALDQLTAMSLVKLPVRRRGGAEVSVVAVHDLLVELGVSIAKEDKRFCRWTNKEKLPDLRRKGSDWQHLVLDIGEKLDLPASFFKLQTDDRPGLRSVVIRGGQAPQLSLSPGLDGCAFLSLAKVTAGEGSASSQVVNLGGLTALQSLDLTSCNALTALESLGELTSLRCLGVSKCGSLKALEGLDKLCHLQRLDLSWCKSLESLESMSGLNKLESLDLRGCTTLTALTGLGGLEKLTGVDLSYCGSLTELDNLSGLQALQTLDVTRCGRLTELQGLGTLHKLQTLILRWCSTLSGLQDLDRLRSLRTLDVKGCRDLTALEGLGGLTQLRQLVVKGCESLFALESLTSLEALEGLGVHECARLTVLEGVGGLVKLQRLDVEHCKALKSIDGLGSLPNLVSLNIKGCPALSTLEDFGAWPSLQTIRVEGCGALTALNGLGGLAGLTKLEVLECGVLTALGGLSGLTGLRHLTLSRCRAVTVLETLTLLGALRTLDVTVCKNLTGLTGLGGLRSLRSLHVARCESLIALDGLGRLPKLEFLSVTHCAGLTTLENMHALGRLHTLELSNCARLATLEGLGGLRSLRFLALNGSEALKTVGGLVSLASNVTGLQLQGCDGLAALDIAAGLARAPKPQEVDVTAAAATSAIEDKRDHWQASGADG